MLKHITGIAGLAMLAGCYLSPNDPTANSEESGLTGSGASNTTYGEVGEGRGRFDEGPFTIYWRWYDTWEQGTCVQIDVRNNGDTLSWWDLTLDLDQPLTQWTYESGAFFWPEGDQLLIEPESSGSFSRRATKKFNYCAEPRAAIVGATVNYEYSGSGSSGSGGDGSSGDGGDGSSGDGDGGDGGSSGGLSERGELFPAPFTLRWRWVSSWDGGSCTQVTLINGDRDLAEWELLLNLSGDARLSSEWGAWYVPSGDSMRVEPNGSGVLRAGATVDFGYCTLPQTAITDARATVTAD